MATQTLIQLKYSNSNTAPTSLSVGEPAYSFVSNTLFIGDGTNVLAIGGRYYTQLLEANTFYATPSTLVTRDSNGNTNFNRVTTNDLYANNDVYAGYTDAVPLPGATNPVIGGGANANNYAQIYIRNINSGSSASADLIAYNDQGSDVSGWIDLGITSNTYNDVNYTVTGPSEGYLFMSAKNGGGQTGNLIIATDSTGTYNDIIFQTGGFTGAKHFIGRWRNGQGLYIDQSTASSSNASGSLISKGGAGIQGNLYADAVYDLNSRVVSTITPAAGGGATFTASKSGNTYTLTVNNTGVQSLSANSGDVTVSASTGNLTFGLATTAVGAGTYGGTNQIPSFTVDTKGRLTFAGNNAISTSFTVAANSGSPDVVNTGETLTIIGNGSGVTTAITNNQLTIGTDSTVVRSNTATVGNQTISSDLTITGNLVVTGTQIYSNSAIYQSNDSLIELAANNTTDALDIGFYGQYGSGGLKYAGLVRKAGTNSFYLLKDLTTNPTSNTITWASVSASNNASLVANITGGTVSGLTAAIAIADGGTNATSFTTGQIIQFDGTKLASLANTGTAGTYGAASRTLTITTNALGLVSSVSNDAIAIGATQITTGILAIARGGTNNNTFTSGQRLIYDGTKLASQANTTTTVTGGLSTANTISSLTINAYGEVTAYTGAAIAIGASQITSGTLGVTYGGTGSSSFNTNGVVISGASSTAALTAVTGSAYQVLQLNASGVPVFGGLNGGTF